MFYDNKWGSVCSDGWGIEEAMTVCRQLNLGYAREAVTGDRFGGTDSKAIMSGVTCRVDEISLFYCQHDEWTNATCSSIDNLAGVICVDGKMQNACSNTILAPEFITLCLVFHVARLIKVFRNTRELTEYLDFLFGDFFKLLFIRDIYHTFCISVLDPKILLRRMHKAGSEYSTKFDSGKLRPEVQTLTLLHTIFNRKGTPFVYLRLKNSTPTHEHCVPFLNPRNEVRSLKPDKGTP